MPPINDPAVQPAIAQFRERLRKNQSGLPLGVFSVCSSHQAVLESTLRFAASRIYPILVESTCNQVNQFGGYTGKTPAQFFLDLESIALNSGISPHQLILGGDHLGPYPWRSLPAAQAMAHATQLVVDCVTAGYTKIHLDASMRCADDDPLLPLAVEVSAARSARLCLNAEKAASILDRQPLYIIGSEVPAPGGEGGSAKSQVTRIENVAETIQAAQEAFAKLGLEAVWERVIGVVVQPGVEFHDQGVEGFNPDRSVDLSRFIERFPALVYEAHSTDYQTGWSLAQMVQGHFAILKVGPELTYAYREMIFALEGIEREMARFTSGMQPSRVSEVLDQVMIEKPEYWSGYYSGSSAEQAFARKFSYLDRVRYYWNHPRIEQAVEQLLANLVPGRIPLGLVSQYLPRQYQQMREGSLSDRPADWIDFQLSLVLEKYYQATSPERMEIEAAE